jgi:hypothetical protein
MLANVARKKIDHLRDGDGWRLGLNPFLGDDILWP